MQEVVPYCMENDLEPPNFLELCIQEGLLKNVRSEKLLPYQERTLKIFTEAYYKTYWQDVVLRIMHFKKP